MIFSHQRMCRQVSVTLTMVVAIVLLMPAMAWSQISALGRDGSAIHLEIGDSVQGIEHALHIADATTSAGGTRRNPGQIRLPARGIWVFFNGLNQAYQFRFDAPFAGQVDGAVIGATIEQAQDAFGTPGREIPVVASPNGRSLLYRLRPDATIRVDFDGAGRAKTIRVLAGTVTFSESASRQKPPSRLAEQVPLVITQPAGVTDLTVPESLRVNRDPGCIELGAVDSSMQPPDIYAASAACVAAGRYPDAVRLFVIAGAEAVFDGMRVKDKTAAQARQVMILNMTNRWSPQQHAKFSDSIKALAGNSAATAQVCKRAQELGPPAYYPKYMIPHGIQALMRGPPNNGLENGFDAKASWATVRHTYLRCGIPSVVARIPEGKLAKYRFNLHDDFFVTSVAWSPNGRYIAADSTQAAEIHVWDVRRRQRVANLRLQLGAPPLYPSLSWSADGRYLVRCDRWLKVYATDNWQLIHTFTASKGGCEYATFSSDGKRLAVLSGPDLSIYAVGTWQLLRSIGLWDGWARGHGFQAMAYVPDTHTLILGGYDFEGILGVNQTMVGRLWEMKDLSSVPEQSIQAYLERGDGHFRGDVRTLAVAPDGARVATGTTTGDGGPPSRAVIDSVHVFELRSGALVAAAPDGLMSGVQRAMSYTPDGRYLIVLQDGEKEGIVILAAATLRVADAFDLDPDSRPYNLSIRGDGREFAVGLGDEIGIWSLPGS